MEGIKFVNLVQTNRDIRGNGSLLIPVDNAPVCNTSFLAADT